MKAKIKRVITFLLTIMIFVSSFLGCSCKGNKEENMLDQFNAYVNENKTKVNTRYKGTYHLTPECGRLGDPNGFIYFKGKYHMFYQATPHNPGATPNSWAHAVSSDLVKWEQLGIVLVPDMDYDVDGCWSGSAIAIGDRLYLIYTGHHDRKGKRVQTICMAYSDDGVNFTKYEKNPIIGPDKIPAGTSLEDFRDPYVWKHEDKYYMLIGTMEPGAAKVLLYQSNDLYNWEFKNNLLRRTNAGFCWECPSFVTFGDVDLYSCSPVDYPHRGYEYWNYNSCIYALGKMNYETGAMEAGDFIELDRGLDYYASQIIYGENNQIICSAWMNSWGRSWITSNLGDGWEGTLSLPRVLTLENGTLIQKPVSAIDNYCKNRVVKSATIEEKTSIDQISGRTIRLKVSADMTSSTYFKISVLSDGEYETYLSYEKERGIFRINREKNQYVISAEPRDGSKGTSRYAEYQITNNLLELDIFIDKNSVEIFIDGGKMVMSALTYNPENADGVYFSSKGQTKITVEKSDIIVD